MGSLGHRLSQEAPVPAVRQQPFDRSSTMQGWTAVPRLRPPPRAFCPWAFEEPGCWLVGGRKLPYLALLTVCLLFFSFFPQKALPFDGMIRCLRPQCSQGSCSAAVHGVTFRRPTQPPGIPRLSSNSYLSWYTAQQPNMLLSHNSLVNNSVVLSNGQ